MRVADIKSEDEFLEPSDEEVLDYAEDDSDVEDAIEHENADFSSNEESDKDEEENLRDWGTSKADYYNADIIETEADALEEEQEARRLQQKHLQHLTEADFGFDENQWSASVEDLRRDTVVERLPELEVKEDASPEEKAQILTSRYPEFKPLAKDFIELQKVYDELSVAAETAEAIVKVKARRSMTTPAVFGEIPTNTTPVATTKLRALSTYLGSIGMYFALLTSTTNSKSKATLAMSPAELRDHAVVQSLFRSRQLWENLRDVVIPELEDVTMEAEAEALAENGAAPLTGLAKSATTNGSAILKPKRKSKSERALIKAQESTQAEERARKEKIEAKLATLDLLLSSGGKEARVKPSKKAMAVAGDESDLGDEQALTVQEAAEKAQRKKSLRFYTSQIAQKSNKRDAASRDAGGDVDLPYKERLKDRQARLMREAETRGRSAAGQGEKLGAEENFDDTEDLRLAKEIREEGVGDNNYYDLISTRTKQKKEERKALAEAQARASQEGGHVHVEEEIGPDGKRAISYAIAKNKGLAPRRKKEVRNPRVKMKMRYEQKMKKLGSMRPVYKGGEGRGGYGGELTGIKTNVLKGVKL